MKAYFLNVDLEVVSRTKLDLLEKGLGKRVIVLHSGPIRRQYLLVLESSRCHNGPDATIHGLCSAVEALPPSGRRLWTAARKTFDVGYELRATERLSQFTLRPDTLHRVAALGARLTVTCYRAEEEAEPGTL